MAVTSLLEVTATSNPGHLGTNINAVNIIYHLAYYNGSVSGTFGRRCLYLSLESVTMGDLGRLRAGEVKKRSNWCMMELGLP